MDLLRRLTRPLRSTDTYRRWVHLVLGGVVLLPYLLAALVVATLVLGDAEVVVTSELEVWVASLVAVAAGAATAALPAVRASQVQLARSLVRGRLADEPLIVPSGPGARARAVAWAAVHLIGGFVVSFATMVVLTEAALLAIRPLAQERPTVLAVSVPLLVDTLEARPWLGPPAGAALLVALVLGVAAVGAILARLAPVLLGPSVADRLAAAQARADELGHRTRLAADLHDSIGHALSVVSLQAGAAARVLDHDPGFARDALEAIAEQARTATAELDHVLGLLRDEGPPTRPARTLADLPDLVDAVRTSGVELRLERSGPLDDVPPVVSREAYRLCQEAVTNALRHGDHRAPIGVEVRADDDRLRVLVTNTAATRRTARAGGGRGLRVMTERLRVHGGEVDARVDGGTWRLAAAIPWRGSR